MRTVAIPLGPVERVKVLAELDSLSFVLPLNLTQFVRAACENGIGVNPQLLEKFEHEDLFRPLFHVSYPKLRFKAEEVGGGVRVLEELKPREKWAGEIHYERTYPAFQYQSLGDWIRAGRISPSTNEFRKPWKRYLARGEECGSPFFSIFQLFTLDFRFRSSSLVDNLAWFLGRNPQDLRAARRFLRSRCHAAKCLLEGASIDKNPRFDTAYLCQVIASRYYFETQGDVRTIRVSECGGKQRTWSQYCRAWRARQVAERLGITPETVREHHTIALHAAEASDPLIDWYDLVRFVALERKEALKGAARFGQLLHSMEGMLRLFYNDLTRTMLTSPLGRFELRDSKGNVENPNESKEALRLVANRYHVNPQPKLYLFVEGEGEQDALPGLIHRHWGVQMQLLGIEIRSLGGVQGFEGGKSDRRSTLHRLIDELHHLQAVTFVLLDNEGHSPSSLSRLRERLSETPSVLHPERTVTRQELLFVWRTCFELENYSDEEITEAMNDFAQGRAVFKAMEIAALRKLHGKRGFSLATFFRNKTGLSLRKREFLRSLVERGSLSRSSPLERPIVKVLKELVHLAALNHQPTLGRTSARNQRSGFLGHAIAGPADKQVEHLYEGLRALARTFGIPSTPHEREQSRDRPG